MVSGVFRNSLYSEFVVPLCQTFFPPKRSLKVWVYTPGWRTQQLISELKSSVLYSHVNRDGHLLYSSLLVSLKFDVVSLLVCFPPYQINPFFIRLSMRYNPYPKTKKAQRELVQRVATVWKYCFPTRRQRLSACGLNLLEIRMRVLFSTCFVNAGLFGVIRSNSLKFNRFDKHSDF